MNFIKDVDQELWPVSKIVSISDSFHVSTGTYTNVRDVTFEDGAVRRFSDLEIAALDFMSRPTFAALPETYRIIYENKKHRADAVLLAPVVGWQIDSWGTASPVCTAIFDDDGIGGILMPDGKATDSHGSLFDDIGKFIEFYRNDGGDE